MAVTKYLDKTGLSHFWSKIKAWANSLFALDSAVVHKTSNETIAGTKTFSSTITGSVSGNAATATDASRLKSSTPNSTAQKVIFTGGQPAIGTSAGNAYVGSSNNVQLISVPEDGTYITQTVANVQNLRFVWNSAYFSDIFISPNNRYVWHRDVVDGTAYPWRRFVEENATGITSPNWDISITGNAATATITKGDKGTGSYVNSVKSGNALVNADNTAFGTIFNAPTKNYRVGCATWPNNNDNIVFYSITNANVSSSTNSTNKTMTWNGDTGILTATGFAGSLTGNVTGNCSGTSANVTGTVAIANGGTGATTRLNAVKALTNENVGSAPNYFLTITSNWAKAGYTSVADAKTALGLKSAAYTESSAYATSGHTHSYLPLAGGTMTGTITANEGNIIKRDVTNNILSIYGGTSSTNGARFELYGGTRSTNPGSFLITASIDSSNNKQLLGKPDGTLTWGGTAISLNGHTHSYLPLSGGTMTGSLTFKNANLTLGTLPSSYQQYVISHVGSDSKNTHCMYFVRNTDGTTTTYIRSFKYSDTSVYGDLTVVCQPNGTTYGTAPTPSSVTDDSNKIATTAWVRDATGNFACNAATATKLGTSTVGSSINPIYLNAGTPTATGSRLYKTIGYNVNANAYVDMLQTYQSDNGNKRSCTIRCMNDDGSNSLYLGVHDESNNAPLGLDIRNTNGAVSLTAFGMLIETGASPHVILQDTDISKGTNPTAINYLCIPFTDKNGTAETDRIGIVESYVDTNGTTCTQIGAYKYVANANTFETLGIKYDKTGTSAYTFAPTPAVTDDSTKIATTAWVRTFCDTTQKYAKSVSVSGSGNAVTTASLSNGTLTLTKGTTFLTTSGNQSISGNKTFSDAIIANGSIKKGNNTESLLLGGGTSWDANGGAHINLYGSDSSGNGRFLLQASKGGSYRHFIGTYDGNLTWNGATVSTSSDKRLKSNIDNVSDDILDTWELVNWEQFKFKDAIDEKGNTARLHVGLIAQDVNELFLNKDLDICDYGILCYDKWEDEYLEIDGKQVLYKAKGDLWTVRYTEALCMEAAYQRRKNKILEKRISELETQVQNMLQVLKSLKGA